MIALGLDYIVHSVCKKNFETRKYSLLEVHFNTGRLHFEFICMVLEWTLSKRLGLAYSKMDLSLLQRQSASQEKQGSMGDSTFSSISLPGILGPGDSMRLALHVHYRPFSVTSEESPRHSEPPLMDTRAPRDRRLHEV